MKLMFFKGWVIFCAVLERWIFYFL